MTCNLLIDTLTDAAIAVDLNHIVTNMNAAAATLFGISSSIMGQPLCAAFGDLCTPIEPLLVLTEAHEEIALLDRNNQTKNLELWILPLEDGGHLAGRLLIFHDVTERVQQAQSMIQEQAHRFQTLIEESSDVIALIDIQANVLYMSPAVINVLGYEQDEMVGKLGFDFVHPDDRDYAATFVGNLVKQPGAVIQLDLRALRKDGSLCWCEVVGRNLLDDPSVQALVINFRDITDRRHAEAQAAELIAERARVKLLASFVRDVSHDFRTALSVVALNVDLLKYTATATEASSHRLENLQAASSVLDRLLERMLFMVKLDSGITLQCDSARVDMLIDHACSQLKAAAQAKHIKIVQQSDNPLLAISLDADLFEQVLHELLENAVTYSPDGGSVTVRSRLQADDSLVIDVSDSGIGIPEADLPYIFERLYRVDKARTGITGHAGLGLTIAQKIVELHGGRILAHSSLGVGSQFEIILPSQA